MELQPFLPYYVGVTRNELPGKLSRKTEDVLRFIDAYWERNLRPPTVREIAAGCGLASPSSAHFHIRKLERLGLIARDRGGATRSRRIASPAWQTLKSVPVVGAIRAGAPILAEEAVEGMLGVPAEWADEGGFLLRVTGDSMTGAGILPADLVLVKPSPSIAPEEIGVFLVGDEATIKRFRIVDGRPALVPENPAYDVLFPEDFRVIGKVAYLLRRYP